MQKFLETKKFFQNFWKIFSRRRREPKSFQPPPPTERKKLKFPSRRRRLPKSFLAAAADGRKKLKISSRRRRERHRLTPLATQSKENAQLHDEISFLRSEYLKSNSMKPIQKLRNYASFVWSASLSQLSSQV